MLLGDDCSISEKCAALGYCNSHGSRIFIFITLYFAITYYKLHKYFIIIFKIQVLVLMRNVFVTVGLVEQIALKLSLAKICHVRTIAMVMEVVFLVLVTATLVSMERVVKLQFNV